MAINRFYLTSFHVGKEVEAKTGGRLVRAYTTDGTEYRGTFNTSSTEKTVRFGKRDFVTSITLSCPTTVPIEDGDIIESNGKSYDVVAHRVAAGPKSHHLIVDLVSCEEDE